MSLSRDEIIDALENARCYDGFDCPFGMYGENDKGAWGCFAKYPNGDPKEENQGCIAHQAARLLKAEKNTSEEKQ